MSNVNGFQPTDSLLKQNTSISLVDSISDDKEEGELSASEECLLGNKTKFNEKQKRSIMNNITKKNLVRKRKKCKDRNTDRIVKPTNENNNKSLLDVNLNDVFSESEGQKDVKTAQKLEHHAAHVSKALKKKEIQMKNLKKFPCHSWTAFKCVLGDKCYYSHEGPGGDPRSKVLCRFVKSGSCLEGIKCPFSHVMKDFPCIFYMKGKCTSGEECRFSHNDFITEEQLKQIEIENAKYHEHCRSKLN